MGKKKKVSKEYDSEKYNVEEVYGTLTSYKDNWGKYIFRGRFEDKPSTIDIRKAKLGDDNFIGKGISLSDSEVDELVDILVSRGYGNTRIINNELHRRKELYGLEENKKLKLKVNR